jgi:hypothetical protein
MVDLRGRRLNLRHNHGATRHARRLTHGSPYTTCYSINNMTWFRCRKIVTRKKNTRIRCSNGTT